MSYLRNIIITLMIFGFLIVYVQEQAGSYYDFGGADLSDYKFDSVMIDYCNPCIPWDECCHRLIIDWACENNPHRIIGIWNMKTGERFNIKRKSKTHYYWEFE